MDEELEVQGNTVFPSVLHFLLLIISLEHKFQGRCGDYPHHAEWYPRRVEGV